MSESGVFITFEGGEGSGKTTQIARLAANLRHAGRYVVTTREPGGTPDAEKIRDLLVRRDGGAWTPMTEMLLLFAARVQHVEMLIRPALDAGKIVICDRFTDSTRAYQGYGHGVPMETIDAAARLSLQDFAPDLTVILDLPAAEGLQRAKSRHANGEDRFEQLDIDFHERLRQGFLDIARQAPRRCRIVDAAGDIDTIADKIAHIVHTTVIPA